MFPEVFFSLGFFEIIVLITLKFFFYLIVRHKLNWTWLCAVCTSISSTWIMMLVGLYFFGHKLVNPTLVALFMGQSIVAVYYFLDKKYGQEYGLMRLPTLLFLTFMGYCLLNPFMDPSNIELWFSFYFILILGLIFFILHNIVEKNGK